MVLEEQTIKKLDYAVVLFIEKKKGKCICTLKVFHFCSVLLKLTFNNVFLAVANRQGTPILFLSAGMLGLKNSNKTTPLATRTLSLQLFESMQVLETTLLHVRLLGYGSRLRVFFAELRSFLRQNKQMQVIWVSNLSRIPLNGCRSYRRVL